MVIHPQINTNSTLYLELDILLVCYCTCLDIRYLLIHFVNFQYLNIYLQLTIICMQQFFIIYVYENH